MSDQNYPDDELSSESVSNEGFSLAPLPSAIDINRTYYIRLAHNPNIFMALRNSVSGTTMDLRSRLYDPPDDRLRFRFISVNGTNRFGIVNNFNNRPRFVVNNINRVIRASENILISAANANYALVQVRPSIYAIITNSDTYVGVIAPNPNNQIEHIRTYTPEQREWYITTDPLAPLPPIRPIEDGIYTIETTLRVGSVIEAPLRPGEEGEPFIKRYDGKFVQLWQFIYDSQLNAYQIIDFNDNCLFAYDSGVPGTPPRQRYRIRFTRRTNQTNASYWTVNPADDGSYNIVSVKYPNQKFDLTLGMTNDNTTVQLYQLNEYDAQNWNLIKRV